MNKITKLVTILVAVFAVANVADARMLSVGSIGVDVANLQSFLIEGGFPIPLIQNGVATPGYFGSQTRDAVMMYQENAGTPLTGVIDSNVSSVKVGSVTGPDSYFPYIGSNDVRTYSFRQKFNTASSTMCSFAVPGQTPGVSSTSLMYFGYRILTNTNPNTNLFDIGYSSTKGSGTTSAALLSSSVATLVATTTLGYTPASFSAALMKSNGSINLVVGTTTGTTAMGYTGYCQAIMVTM